MKVCDVCFGPEVLTVELHVEDQPDHLYDRFKRAKVWDLCERCRSCLLDEDWQSLADLYRMRKGKA